MKKVLNRLLLVLLILSSKSILSQIDTVFWFAAPWVTTGHASNIPVVLRLSSFNNATTVRVRQPASTFDTTFTIPANSLVSESLSHLINQIENNPANTVFNRGLKITSNFPITAIYEVVTVVNNPETYSMKGQNGMGLEFVCPFQTKSFNGPYAPAPKSQIDIVATQNGTVVWITPKCAVVGHAANVTYSIGLNAGQSYGIENITSAASTAGQNLSGTIVVSNKPISITVSDDSVRGVSGCYDLMGDQIVPVEVVGTEYIINKGGLNAGENEGAYIVATQNFTQVNINDGAVSSVLLNKGDTYYYNTIQPLTYITGDKPVYVIHASGFGCEMGEAIIPPLNCAGSDQVSFTRTNNQTFILNILCKTASKGNFLLNGSAVLVPAAGFTVVPGTGGLWSGFQRSYTTVEIPSGVTNLLSNSNPIDSLFAMGVINGGGSSGCLYHYMSSFLRKVYVNSGIDKNICTATTTISLNGSVDGGATTGIWTTPDGTGTFGNVISLNTTYTLSANDLNQSQIKFILSSTGNCTPIKDTMFLNIFKSPIVDAGNGLTLCKNNISLIPLAGTLQLAAGANWTSSGTGSFGNPGALNTTYLPSPGDLVADSVIIKLTSTGSLNGCPNRNDSLKIKFTNAPVVAIGPDVSVCANNATVAINGSVTVGSTTGIWSGGNGTFNASNTSLIASYIPTSTEITAGSVNLILASTNNGNCKQVKDSILITFTAAPFVNAGVDLVACENNATMVLSGIVSGPTTTGAWSGGTGIYNPGNTSLNSLYTPSAAEIAAGSVSLTLTSTNNLNCNQTVDNIIIDFTNAPAVNAGLNLTACKNNATALLSGLVSGPTTTGIWSGASGSFNPGNTALTGTYTPSASELSAGFVDLILSSTNNGTCNQVVDTVKIIFTGAPIVAIGPDVSLCANNATIAINASVTVGATTGIWTGGNGTFNASNTSLSITYIPTPAEILAGSANLVLSSTNNGNCKQEKDSILLTFTTAPSVNAGSNLISCINNASTILSGNVSGPTNTGYWSGGTGAFNPDSSVLGSTYTPSAAEITAGFVNLILNSSNNGNCNTVTDTVLINFTNAPAVNAGLNLSVCKNNPITILSGLVTGPTTTGIWSGVSGSFSPNNAALTATYTPSASELSAGFADLILSSTNNGTCNQAIDTLKILFTGAPIVAIGPDLSVCVNNATIAINGSVTIGSTSGVWSGGSGTFNPGNSVLSTTYTPTSGEILAGFTTLVLSSTNNGNCFQEKDSILVSFTNAPNVDAGFNLTSCANNASSILSGNVFGTTTTGYWSGGTGIFSPDSSVLGSTYTPSAAEIAAGFVNLILNSSNNGNCNTVKDTVLINFTNAPAVNAGVNVSVCRNNAITTLSGLVTGPTTTGIWSGASGSFSPNNTALTGTYTPSASELSAGFADLILSSTNNGTCNQAIDTLKILFTGAPIVAIGPDVSVCVNNATIAINGSVTIGSTSGVWSGGSGTFNPGNSVLSTTYTPTPGEILAGFTTLVLSSTNNGNCFQEKDSILVSFTNAPNVDAGFNLSPCANNASSILSGNIFGTTNTGYWSGGTGTYNPDSSVFGATYIPSVAEINAGFVNLILNSTNNGNCNQVKDTVLINFTSAPFVNAGANLSVCKNNATTVFSGLISGATTTGVWSGASGIFNPNSTALSGTYTPSSSELSAGFVNLILSSTNNGTCNQEIDTLKITFTGSPIAAAGPDVSVCANNPTVNINGSVMVGSTTGVWSGNGSGSFSPSNTSLNMTYQLSPSDIAIGSVTIKLTSSNNGNCFSANDSLLITVTPKPLVDAGINDTICSSNIFYPINGNISGGASAGTWTTLGNGVFGNPNNLNTIYTLGQGDTLAGQVQLVLTSTGNNCLPETDTVLVVIAKSPLVNSGFDNTVCDNQQILLNGTVVGLTTSGVWTTLGTGIFTPDDSLLTTYYQPSVLDVSNGSVELLLTSTYNKGCASVHDTVKLNFKSSPNADFNTNNVCSKKLATFTDNSNTSTGTITGWYWDFGDTGTSIANNATHAYTNPGTYTVSHVAYSSNGCNDTIKKPIDIYFLPQAQFYQNVSCIGNATQFVDSTKTLSGSIVQWQWNFGDTQNSNIQNPQHAFSSANNYTVMLIATSSFGCKDTIKKAITVIPGPNADFNFSPNPVEALETVNYTDLSTGPSSLVNWYWAFGDSTAANTQNTTHAYNSQGDFSILLVVKDINGCIDSTRKDISIVLLPDVPTAFSPNGDGQNDLFLVRGGPFKTIVVRVYNNWGQLIFETNDQLEGWDGNFKGTEQPIGVFVWVVEVEMLNGKTVKKTGDVTLLR